MAQNIISNKKNLKVQFLFVVAAALQFQDEMVEELVFRDEKGDPSFLVRLPHNRK